MGILLNGILGGVSGKVGGVVGSNWKGISTLRAYAIPANPQSAGQTAQRAKFSAILTFVKSMLTAIIQVYWDPFASGQSGFNAAMSANLNLWSDDIGWDEGVVSQGNLEGAALTAAVYGAPDVIFSFTQNVTGNGLLTDKAVGVVFDKVNNMAYFNSASTRDDEELTVATTTGLTETDLQCYLFFTRGSGETLEVSNSSYHVGEPE